MTHNAVRTDVGEAGPGSWVDQQGQVDGSAAVYLAHGTAIGWESFETVSVSTTAVGLTTATVGNHAEAFITCEVAAVRFRFDVTAPTATVGHILGVGDVLTLTSNAALKAVRFISRDGTTATLAVSYGDRE